MLYLIGSQFKLGPINNPVIDQQAAGGGGLFSLIHSFTHVYSLMKLSNQGVTKTEERLISAMYLFWWPRGLSIPNH